MFEGYYTEYGIRHEKTIPNTIEHKGKSMNHTTIERVTTMLRMSRLPKEFRGEFVHTIFYLINRSPSVPLNSDIPERVEGEGHLGCKAYIHLPKEKMTKLDDKAIPCIFFGFVDEEFEFILWDPQNKKNVRNRDVF